jgi:hypothetical protein
MKPLRLPGIVLALAIVAAAGCADTPSANPPISPDGGGGGAAAGCTMDPMASRDVIVGFVTKVSSGYATNGDPARVTFTVTETLKGEIKGTVVVSWGGPPHDVDYGDPRTNPRYISWAAQQAGKPTLGDVYILFGGLSDPRDKGALEQQWFYTEPGGRMPLTAENRKKALDAIKAVDAAAKVELDRRAAEAAKHAAAVKEWRAGMTDEKLAAAIKEADFVALVKVSGYFVGYTDYTFVVTEVLKGRKRYVYKNDSYFLQMKVTKEVADVLDHESEYVVLVSEKGLILPPGAPTYHPIGEGVVLADAATMKLARELTKGLAGKGPPAVLVYPNDPATAEALEAVADGKVTVMRGSVFSGALPLDRVAADGGVNADFLLRVERQRASGGDKPWVKLQLARRDAAKTLLFDKTLTDTDGKVLAVDAVSIIAAILKAE